MAASRRASETGFMGSKRRCPVERVRLRGTVTDTLPPALPPRPGAVRVISICGYGLRGAGDALDHDVVGPLHGSGEVVDRLQAVPGLGAVGTAHR